MCQLVATRPEIQGTYLDSPCSSMFIFLIDHVAHATRPDELEIAFLISETASYELFLYLDAYNLIPAISLSVLNVLRGNTSVIVHPCLNPSSESSRQGAPQLDNSGWHLYAS